VVASPSVRWYSWSCIKNSNCPSRSYKNLSAGILIILIVFQEIYMEGGAMKEGFTLVRKDMNVNEHERLSNYPTLH
jgi:hypothetical protein